MRIIKIFSITSLLLLTSLVHAEAMPPVSIMSFDFDDENWKGSDIGGYKFYPESDLGCGDYHLYQDKLCDDEKRMFMYFGHIDKYIQDWKRFGVFMPEFDYSISGNALKLSYTGGLDMGDNGKFQQHGKEIYSLSDYEYALQGDIDEMYSNISLQGQPSIYVKSKNDNATTLNQFSGINRFAIHVWYPASDDRHMRFSREVDKVNSPPKTSAFYPFLDSAKAGHSYHHATNRAYGSWIKVQFDARPTHYNSGNFNETHSYGEGGIESVGDSVEYFERIAAYAVRFHEPKSRMSPFTMLTDDWIAYHVKYENEETIASLGVGFDPEDGAFDVSFEDKYRCTDCDGVYDVKYSFSPITNENFDNAFSFTKIENFFIEDDSEIGYIIKPNAAFNQVWAKAFLPTYDVDRVESGETIYFAVKDLSDRADVLNSERDYILTMTASGELKPMKDLIKSISYTFSPSPFSNLVALPKKLHLKQQVATLVPIGKSLDDYASRLYITGEDSLRAYEKTKNDKSSLLFDPILEGEYKINIKGYSEDGKVLIHKNIEVGVGKEFCDTMDDCFYYTLVDFSRGNVDVRYNEFKEYFYDENTGFNGNGFSALPGTELFDNVQGIMGWGKKFRVDDMVVVNIKSTALENKWISPFISKYSQASMRGISDTLWHSLPRKYVKSGEIASWLVPAETMLNNDDFVSRVSVSIKEKDVALMSIGYYSRDVMKCKLCGNILVDFNDGGPFHTTPIRGWTKTMQSPYTNHVGNGLGITVGSNPSYSYAGIRGDYSLRAITKTVYVHWDNYSEHPVTFTPRFSVYDDDSPVMGAEGEWFDVGEITVNPGEKNKQEVPLPGGQFNIFNVNINHKSNSVISLDKITM